MNGILIIDKPAGITSHDVVARVRRILRTKRVGHTGTLDPFATGVMVVLVGQATRLAQYLDKDEKEYEAVIRFGFETDTGDATGMRSAECEMRNEEIEQRIAATDWEKVFAQFRGDIEQVPPMYSAKKVDGKKLYEHARKGINIERKPVPVTIGELELTKLADSSEPLAIGFRVVCSAGTYVRTLAEDIGRKTGLLGHLTRLRRTRAGRFPIEQSVSLDELAEMQDPNDALLPMSEAVSHLAKMDLNEDRVQKTRGGLSTRIFEANFADGQAIRMLGENGELIAVGIYRESENSVQPKVVLV